MSATSSHAPRRSPLAALRTAWPVQLLLAAQPLHALGTALALGGAALVSGRAPGRPPWWP